jgi:hypothetical protein
MSKQENRVLGRIGARLITEVESTVVKGGILAATVCTLGPHHSVDGDVGAAGCH